MKVNPLMKCGEATEHFDDLGISSEQYGEFLIELFDLYFDDPEPTIRIDPIQKHVGRIFALDGSVHECHFTRSCHEFFIGISPDGDMYPCGMFQAESSFRYGNITSLAPESISSTALFKEIGQREERMLEGCAECAFLDLCYGGCMYHSLKNRGQFAEKDYYCAGYRLYFAHMVQRLHRDITNAHRLVSIGQSPVVVSVLSH